MVSFFCANVSVLYLRNRRERPHTGMARLDGRAFRDQPRIHFPLALRGSIARPTRKTAASAIHPVADAEAVTKKGWTDSLATEHLLSYRVTYKKVVPGVPCGWKDTYATFCAATRRVPTKCYCGVANKAPQTHGEDREKIARKTRKLTGESRLAHCNLSSCSLVYSLSQTRPPA